MTLCSATAESLWLRDLGGVVNEHTGCPLVEVGFFEGMGQVACFICRPRASAVNRVWIGLRT